MLVGVETGTTILQDTDNDGITAEKHLKFGAIQNAVMSDFDVEIIR